MNYKLSIITINRNNAEGLRKTIESVMSQTFTDYEFIVIDGASEDDSADVVKQFVDKITYWVSEPDNGIFNAMNKGILKATGEYILFLNSGDWLVDKNVIEDFYTLNSTANIITGDIFLWDNHEAVLRKSPELEDIHYGKFYNDSIPHPASFIKRKLFEDHGLYNESYKLVSDWEFFFNCLIINHCTYNHFDRPICYFDLTGISNSKEWRSLQEKEREMVLQNYLPLVYKAYKKIYNENLKLSSHEIEYREYMNLKNGKFSLFVKFILLLKRVFK